MRRERSRVSDTSSAVRVRLHGREHGSGDHEAEAGGGPMPMTAIAIRKATDPAESPIDLLERPADLDGEATFAREVQDAQARTGDTGVLEERIGDFPAGGPERLRSHGDLRRRVWCGDHPAVGEDELGDDGRAAEGFGWQARNSAPGRPDPDRERRGLVPGGLRRPGCAARSERART